jgi:hypothetical protein
MVSQINIENCKKLSSESLESWNSIPEAVTVWKM